MSAETLAQIFKALSSGSPEEIRDLNEQLLTLQSTQPDQCLFSCAEILAADTLEETVVFKSISLIKSILKPNASQSDKQLRSFWASLPQENRTMIKEGIYKCLMINQTSIQGIAALVLAVISKIDLKEEASTIFSFLHDLFTDTEQYGEESKFGALVSMQEVIRFDDYSFLVKAGSHYQSDAEIVLEDTYAILSAEECPLNLRRQALETLITLAEGYSLRATQVFEDDDIASKFISTTVDNFSIEDAEYHIRLYDLLYILFTQKYAEIESMFEELFSRISGDFTSPNKPIFYACLEFWTKIANLQLSIINSHSGNPEEEEDIPHYIEEIVETVSPVLLQSLCNDTDDENERFDPSFKNPARQSRILIESFAYFIPEPIFQVCTDFFKEKMESDKWNEKLGGLLALQAGLHILARNDKNEGAEFAYQSLEDILPLTEHDHFAVREQTIYMLSEIAADFPPSAEVLIPLLERSLEWMQNPPIDAAASCVLTRKIVQKIELGQEVFDAIIGHLFDILHREDATVFPLLLENAANTFIIVMRNAALKVENTGLLNTVCESCIESLEELIPAEMEASQKTPILNVLCTVLEEYATVFPRNCQSDFNPCLIASIDHLFAMANPDSFIDGYRIIATMITKISGSADSEEFAKKAEFYEGLMQQLLEIMHSDDTTDLMTASEVIPRFFFACPELAQQYCIPAMELLMPAIEEEMQTNQFRFKVINAAGYVIRAQPDELREQARVAREITKNIMKAGLQQEEIPDFIEAAISVNQAFIEAFQNEFTVLRPLINDTNLFAPIKLAANMPKKTVYIYNLVYGYIRTMVYCNAKNEFNVMLRKNFVQSFFSSETLKTIKSFAVDLSSSVISLNNALKRL